MHAQGTQEATTIEKTCSAQLDGVALEAILAQGPAWEGLRASAQDVWAGHKEDPQKVHQMIPDCYGDALPALSTVGLRFLRCLLAKAQGVKAPQKGRLFCARQIKSESFE